MIQTQQTLDEKYAQLSAERQELFWVRFTSSLLRIPSPTVMFCRRNFRMWFILSLASLLHWGWRTTVTPLARATPPGRVKRSNEKLT